MLTKLVCISLMGASLVSVAKDKDYENFDLPEEKKVALPDSKFAYASQRVSIKGSRVDISQPSVNHQTFMFAREIFLTEKRDEAIKILRQELDAGHNANRDNALMRLGSLYTEKYMELSFRENEIFSQRYAEYEKKRAAGDKSIVVPKVDSGRSQFYLKEGLKVFYTLEKEYPKHPKMDEIVYFIGFVEMESGNIAKGKPYLERILTKYPTSKKYEEAAVYLADGLFDQAKFRDAAAKYKLLLARNSSLKDYVKYKLAWCDLNTGHSERALRDMKTLINYLAGTPDTAKFNLREQALKDLVAFYADSGDVADAMAFFSKAQNKTKALENLKVLADILRAKARDDAAIKAYAILIKEFGEAPESPKWYLGIYECESRLGRAKGGLTKLLELMDRYGETSEWAKNYPAEKAGELKETLALIATESEKAAYFQHQAGQKSANKGHYESAIKLYTSILKNFPTFENRKKVSFFLAEALYNQNKWLEAADSYMVAAKIAPKDKLSDEGIYNALLSVDHLTVKPEKIEKINKEEAKKVDITPKEIPLPEKKFIEIGEYYIQEYPQGERVADIRFRIGSIYYQNRHYDQAMEIFQDIALKNSKHRTASTAANLVLDIYNIRKDYTGLTKQAQAYFDKADLGDKDFKAEMKTLIGEVDFKQIEPLEKDSKWTAAGDSYFKFYQGNSTSKLAEKALYNAYVAYDKGGDEAKAAEMAKVFIAKFPASEFTPKVTLTLAKVSEQQYDFEQAQRIYRDFAKKYPKDKEAKKALYNAALFAEITEQNKESLALWEQYQKEGLQADEKKAILISQAKLHRKLGNWDKMASIYRQLMKESRGSEEKFGYLAEMARQYEKAGKVTEKNAIAKEIRGLLDGKKKESLGAAAVFAAEAEFNSLKPQREKYQAIKLRFPPEDLLYLLKRKEKALSKLSSQYDGVVEFGVPDWGVAALWEKGLAYREFVDAYRAVKIPKSYKAEELTEVENSLKAIDQKMVAPLEAKAQEIFKACSERAAQFKVVNEYATSCTKKLQNDKSTVQVTGLLPSPSYWSLRSVGGEIVKK